MTYSKQGGDVIGATCQSSQNVVGNHCCLSFCSSSDTCSTSNLQHCHSHITLTVTLGCLLVLHFSLRIFQEKRDCSQSNTEPIKIMNYKIYAKNKNLLPNNGINSFYYILLLINLIMSLYFNFSLRFFSDFSCRIFVQRNTKVSARSCLTSSSKQEMPAACWRHTCLWLLKALALMMIVVCF